MNSPTVEESRIPQYYDSESSKVYINSQQIEAYETEVKHKIENILSPMPHLHTETDLDAKIKFELSSPKTETTPIKKDIRLQLLENIVKPEKSELEINCKSETEPVDMTDYKTEPLELKHYSLALEKNEIFKSKVSKIEKVDKTEVEIVDQNEHDIEMEEFSSPVAVIESEIMLKQRLADMRLKLHNKIEDRKCGNERIDDKSDADSEFDEFDVEAQMKKITGDDGDDYKEKIDTSSERDKSMDGLEGLMDSSKEDSDSDGKDTEDFKSCKTSFTKGKESIEERAFKVNIFLTSILFFIKLTQVMFEILIFVLGT